MFAVVVLLFFMLFLFRSSPSHSQTPPSRTSGDEYEAVIDEFMDAVYHRYPNGEEASDQRDVM